MIALLALLFMILGTAFLVVAVVGVLRFQDPFQRMHAATKAGTLGAGLVLIGAMLAMQSTGATVIATLTLVFLVATLPVTGHLLGRAAYVSGAPLRSQEDALAGVLPRAELPLEQRLEFGYVAPARVDASLEEAVSAPPAPAGAARSPAPAAQAHAAQAPAAAPAAEASPEAGYSGVRFAVIAPHSRTVTRRAMRLAAARGVSLTAVAVIDRHCVENARVPQAREAIRSKLALAIEEMRGELGGSPSSFSLSYEEGDPLALIPVEGEGSRELLVLPTDGWCHHGARVNIPEIEERQVEKLFQVAEKHAGPSLFVGETDGGGDRIVVRHDGSERLQQRAEWALGAGLWPAKEVVVIGEADAAQIEALTALATARGITLAHIRNAGASAGAMLPPAYADAAALVLPRLPAEAAGAGWFEKLAPGWRGDVLV